MLSTIARVAGMAAALVLTASAFALAETSATPAAASKIAQTKPAPTATPFRAFTYSGFGRAYYFTRQNASNNPGTQFNFSTNKCVSGGNCVNQASFESAVDFHADYNFQNTPWSVGGSYFYAQPFSGACSVASQHRKGLPCVSQIPPNTNPDDTLPGFMMSTFPEAYLAFNTADFHGKIGDQLFTSPWAAPYDGTRVKPAAYQGADFAYTLNNTPNSAWNFELADMIQFQNRTSNTFQSNTLLTSFPAGGGGMASNIVQPGCLSSTCAGISTPGFFYGKVGYGSSAGNPWTVDGYFYGVSQIVNMYWGDAKYSFAPKMMWNPYVALQGGWESNTGPSVIGKIRSSDFGLQLGANATKNVLVTAGFDSIPWNYDNVFLPGGATCSASTHQITAGTKVNPPVNFAYFLPLNAAQCQTNKATGLTQIAYGGWASPYTDNYATDPFFTSSISQGMADRRSPGTSFKIAGQYTSNNRRWVFIATDAWYNYGNSIAGQNTNEWDLDGTYRFSNVQPHAHYKGLALRYRYMQRSQTNTFYCAGGSPCPAGQSATAPAAYLGGVPLFKYNRAQVEYDF
ncbi:MAG: hypothetical protein JO199_09085 [Candidatus Eremiobacteraeota bacterium]|nr:hypothetical protein [Candidatus Eremiobacteraeota bacterium]